MSVHLSDEQVSRLLADSLPEADAREAEAHLWDCPACRAVVRRRTDPAPELPPLSAPWPGRRDPASAHDPDAPPAVAGYEVVEELGRGGMGVVWKACQLRAKRTVALKVLRAGPTDPDARRRLLGEAEALARLQHAGIVQVYEVGEQDGRPYFSLEFCPGGSLAARLADGPMPPAEAAAAAEAVARAVGAAHRAGILHRDLKPANVLLAADGTLKVSDFGLAKSLDGDASHLSRSGVILGTPSYTAPEQVAGRVGAAADVYSVGAILYECLTGRPPFQAGTVIETLELVRTQEPLPVRQAQPGVPRDLETICRKCLEKEPARRYGSADELAADLHCFREGRPIAARPVSRPERLARWARRNPVPAALAALSVVALVAGFTASLTLWWRAERHLRQEETARREAEDNYQTCRQMLAEYVAVTRASRVPAPAARSAQREALSKARAFCEGLRRRRPDDPGLRPDLAEVCTGLAALDAHDGRLDQAIEVGEIARGLWRQLADEDRHAPRRRDRLASVAETLGRVYGQLGRAAEAERALRQAIALWDRLAEEGPAPTDALIAAAGARESLATVMSAYARRDELSRLFEENCAGLAREESRHDTPPELRLALLVNLTGLGQWLQNEGDQAGAERCWRRGYELGRRLAEEMPDSGRVLAYMANCARELAVTDPAAAPPAETARLCEQAARLMEAQRLRDPADRDLAQALARMCWALADIHLQANQHAEGLRTARRAARVLADLAARQPGNPSAQLDVIVAQARLAARERKCGDPPAAQATSRLVAEGFERFCAAWSADPTALALAGQTDTGIATSLRHAGALAESLRVAERCRRIFDHLNRQHPDEPQYLLGLSEASTQIAKTRWREGDHAATEAALRAALANASRLAERASEFGPLRAERLRRLGRFLEERARTGNAAAAVPRAR